MGYDYASYLADRFPEIESLSFYRDLFPVGTLQAQRDGRKGEYPAIAVVIRDGGNLRHTVTDDLSAIREIIETAEKGDLCVMSPASYAGQTQRKSMAHALHALVFDVDGLKVKNGEPTGLLQLLYQTDEILDTPGAAFAIPRPTYIVSSGTGLHLYYILDESIPMRRETVRRIEAYRRVLTKRIWNSDVTNLSDSIQYEHSTQGFRMVGTPVKPKAGDGVVRAFLTGDKVSVAYMDGFVPEGSRIGPLKASNDSVSLDEAKSRWPEWYERRVVQGVPRKTWRPKRDLYEWWKRRVMSEGDAGHRYWCIVALAAYAKKCGIPKDELEADAEELRTVLDNRRREPGDSFTGEDVKAALTAYRTGMVTYPIWSIAERTGIAIEKNKRNGRPQAVHIQIMSATRDILHPDGSWRNRNGAPEKKDLIRGYALEHPGESNRAIAEALGVSRNTVNKWLKPGWEREHAMETFDSFVERDLAEGEYEPHGTIEYALIDFKNGETLVGPRTHNTEEVMAAREAQDDERGQVPDALPDMLPDASGNGLGWSDES